MVYAPVFYCDMDGVLANWDEPFEEAGRSLASFEDQPSEVFWQYFKDTFNGGDQYYYKLDPFEGAYDFYHTLKEMVLAAGYKFEILTALITLEHSSVVRAEKEAWVKDVLKDETTRINLGPLAHQKQHWCRYKTDILLDDRKSNIRQWEEAGGFGILHTNFEDSLKKAELVLAENPIPVLLDYSRGSA